MTERPYKDYDVARLFAEKRGTEDALMHVKREHSAYLKSVYGRPSYNPGVYQDEDCVGMSRHIDSLSKDLAEINATRRGGVQFHLLPHRQATLAAVGPP